MITTVNLGGLATTGQDQHMPSHLGLIVFLSKSDSKNTNYQTLQICRKMIYYKSENDVVKCP